jgi:hypothetical protein
VRTPDVDDPEAREGVVVIIVHPTAGGHAAPICGRAFFEWEKVAEEGDAQSFGVLIAQGIQLG